MAKFFHELSNSQLLRKGLSELDQAVMRSVYSTGVRVFSNLMEAIPLGLLPEVHTDTPQGNITALSALNSTLACNLLTEFKEDFYKRVICIKPGHAS
jgi:hypothetical protein